MTKTIRIGVALAMALAATSALAGDAVASASTKAAQPCDTRGYDGPAMKSRDGACAPVIAVGGGYDVAAMEAIDGVRPATVARGAASTPYAPDEFTLRVWSAP